MEGMRVMEVRMRRVILTGTVVMMVLGLMVPAFAKGPTGATITGPGIDQPIELGMEDDLLWTIAEQSGFNAMMFEHPLEPGSGPLKMPPVGDLGPFYVITFYMGDMAIPLEIYPNAPLGPIADSPANPTGPLMHVAGGVDPAVFGKDERMFTWYKPVAALNRSLVSVGVPIEVDQASLPLVVPTTVAEASPTTSVTPSVPLAAAAAVEAPATTLAAPAPAPTPAPRGSSPVLPIVVVAGAVVAAAAVVGVSRRRRSLAG
jgi:hypothetical protein